MLKALTIAGFDGSGGAGIQADLKTFSALGCYGMCVLTALPVQNTQGVRNCYEIELKAIKEQLECIFDDIIPDAIKIGMLFNSDIIKLVADFLNNNAKNIPIVVDPVMVAKSGDRLLLEEAVDSLKKYILPIATIVTPNIPEAEDLTSRKIKTDDGMIEAANDILNIGAKNVMLKGGHLEGELSRDLFMSKESKEFLDALRIDTKNTHGTGCTLSAAICSYMAHGKTPLEASKLGKEYLFNALKAGKTDSVGKGHGPVHHFYEAWTHLNI
ncbi:bifunctional hydroxymethylpyrimidine kinase/phosphomethylpyrimidine kinase [Brachyspira hampsonii]|uniref:bifunctional hydroxymethylpyrimidine kinase/phosphomethylpyrimidine kinase n=1 Tax=Brachyspira hampsonii TaxID=1287055 RepID=UPI000D3A2C04|nr:bifunctional hydroxymethylpyrimidine kinase/phosphomethylpyrimidine kinase [Brachyspira hampsonii]PTY41166.1 phosphomethylpyrimidine kinase [Brachyspira hampsonii bv. II]